MTSVPKPASLGSSLTLKWDAWNRLVEAKDGEVVVGVYEYDALQRRVKRHIDSQAPVSPNGVDTFIHYFYNSAWQVLETRDTTTENDPPENLQPKYQYIWSPRYVDAAVLRDKNTDVDGLCDDERIYFLNDANFNVTTLVDIGGDAVERYLYDAYGRVTVYDGAWSNTRGASSYANVVMYTGRERDVETGLYQYRHRYYAAELGRFGSRDPSGYKGGINLYNYCGDSPLANTDPSGRFRHTGTWYEACTCVAKCNPAACVHANSLAKTANDLMRENFPALGQNDEANAFLHCVWSCLIRRRTNSCQDTKCVTNNHEDANTADGQPPEQRNMDVSNNTVGCGIGAAALTDDDCVTGCNKALADGKLVVLNPTPRRKPPVRQ
jgi:RHS repeat-associated protein